MSQIILASNSPRRKELLTQMGLSFEVCPAKGEEVITTSVPKEVVMELSKQKAEEVAAGYLSWYEKKSIEQLASADDILVIGADTVVACKEQILGKPENEKKAKEMLRMLSGNTHSVYTGVTCVFIDKSGRCGEHVFYEKTDVTVAELSEEEIDRYVKTGDPMDKAGSYGIQGPFAIHIKEICGDYFNVVGLPIARLYAEMISLGIDLYLW